MLPATPDCNLIGRIYGPDGNAPIKSSLTLCFIVTRITKTKVFARQLQTTEILNPVGNGFFDERNLGITAIHKPLTAFGEEIPFFVYHTHVGGGREIHYVRHKNMILYGIDENVVWRTLSAESSVFCKTSWQ
jgi:hypothetical protein